MARPKQKAIGTPASTVAATSPTKKISRLRLPSGFSEGPASQKPPATSATSARRAQCPRRAGQPQQPDDGHQQHQPEAHRQRRGAPAAGDLQRRGDDEALLDRVVDGGVQHEQQEADRCGDGQRFEETRPAAMARGSPAPSSAYARRGGRRPPRRAWPARGTGSRPARPTRPASCGRRSGRRCRPAAPPSPPRPARPPPSPPPGRARLPPALPSA